MCLCVNVYSSTNFWFIKSDVLLLGIYIFETSYFFINCPYYCYEVFIFISGLKFNLSDLFSFLLNLLEWHWLIYRLQVYNYLQLSYSYYIHNICLLSFHFQPICVCKISCDSYKQFLVGFWFFLSNLTTSVFYLKCLIYLHLMKFLKWVGLNMV